MFEWKLCFQLCIPLIDFPGLNSEVRTQAEQIKIRHERFQDLVNTCDTYSSQEFKELRKGILISSGLAQPY